MANKYSSVTVTGYNASPPPDDGSTTAANEITWSGQKSKLADPIKTALDAVNSNTLSAFGQQFGYNIEAVSTDLTLGAADTNKFIATTGTHTLTLPAAATAGSSTLYAIINAGTGTTTVAGNGSETIDGANTIALAPGQFAFIAGNGSAWDSASNRTRPLQGAIRGYLAGLTLSRNAGTPNTKIDVSAGQATDDTNVGLMTLAATATIDTGIVGANGLDAGVLALSTGYHAYLIAKADGTTAGLLSTNVSSPTLPSGYTIKRRIGWVKTNASTQFLDFTQDGDLFQWVASVQDVNATNPGTAAVTETLTVPVGVAVVAIIQAIINSSASTPAVVARLSDLATADETPSGTNADIGGAATVAGAASPQAARLEVRTNTSAQIRARLNASAATVALTIRTIGWKDSRGRFS